MSEILNERYSRRARCPANASSVTASYFEWVQNVQAFSWEEDRVNEQLKNTCCKPINRCAALKERSARIRTAAFGIAIERVAKAEKIRGDL